MAFPGAERRRLLDQALVALAGALSLLAWLAVSIVWFFVSWDLGEPLFVVQAEGSDRYRIGTRLVALGRAVSLRRHGRWR